MTPVAMKLRHFALALLFVTAPAAVEGSTINWGNFPNPGGQYLFDSAGVALDDSYIFELGTFGTFVPLTTNLGDWALYWKTFDRAIAPEIEGWNSATGSLGSSATIEADFTTDNASITPQHTFAVGEQAYIWAFKTSNVYAAGFEWALLTNKFDGIVDGSGDDDSSDDWLIPAPAGHGNNVKDWFIEDATFSPFGGLNDTQHPGDYSSTPAAQFILQTHTELAPVPEPSSALLIAASLVFFRRRRK
jgi:hypothetical protein